MYSKAQNRATQKFIKNNYDEIKIRVPKGRKNIYKDMAKRAGFSLNNFVISLLDAKDTTKNKTFLPNLSVRQVLATMAIENMYFSKSFIDKMIKVANGETSSKEVRDEIIKKYAR